MEDKELIFNTAISVSKKEIIREGFESILQPHYKVYFLNVKEA